MQTLRIFISSPGDVAEERDRARQVIEGLRRRYVGRFHLQPLLWEDLPLQPAMSFQQGIDAVLSGDQGVDIAVFILWSRLGSPLGPLIHKPDGSEYRSGTEREFDLMMRAREQSGGLRPHVLIYTRRDEASFDERLRGKSTGEKQSLLDQKKLIESFIAEEFQDPETGRSAAAYHTFDRPATFSSRLETHLKNILDGLSGDSPDVAWDIDKNGPPFVGLAAFQPEHADVFWGRNAEILEARRALAAKAREGCPFLLLSGASGSGKSSLARAGILPAIRDNERDDTISAWKTLILTPDELAPDPLNAFLTHLADDSHLPSLRADPDSWQALLSGARKDPRLTYELRLHEALGGLKTLHRGNTRLLLLIDQWEEFYSSSAIATAGRHAFLALLEALAKGGRCWILATIRSDFYQHLAGDSVLVRMKSGAGCLDILPPRPENLADIITGPARMAGLRYEEKDGKTLDRLILQQAASRTQLLPLLGFVLRELYEQRTDDKLLTYAVYQSLGGVEGALARHAETTFLALPESVQATLPRILQHVVTIGQSDDSAEQERVVRRHAQFTAFPEASPARQLIDAFITHRLFTTGKGADAPTFTVAHESLLRVWPRASTWAEGNRDLLRIRARIDRRMAERSPLLDGDPLLDAAQRHLDATPEAFSTAQAAFIQQALNAVEGQQRRATRRRRLVLTSLSLLTLAACFGTWFSLRAKNKADKAKQEALEAKGETEQKVKQLALTLHEASMADFSTAVQYIEKEDKWAEGVAYLARALKWNPKNQPAAAYLYATLVANTGKKPRLPISFVRQEQPTDGVIFSQDYQRLMVWAGNYVVVGETVGGQGLGKAMLHENRILKASFSPDGLWVGTVDSDHTVRLWNVETGKSVGEPMKHEQEINEINFSPDGRLIVTVGVDGKARLWNVSTCNMAVNPLQHDHQVLNAAFSPDGHLIVTVSNDCTARMWNVPAGTSVGEPMRHSNKILKVNFSPDGRLIVTASDDMTARLWDAASGKPVGEPMWHENAVVSASFSPDGTRIVTASEDKTARLWDAATCLADEMPLKHERPLTGATFSPDGCQILTVCEDNSVREWDVSSGRIVKEPLWHKSRMQFADYGKLGHLIITLSGNEQGVWDVGQIPTVADPVRLQGDAQYIAFSVDGGLIVGMKDDGVSRLWSAETGQPVEKAMLFKNKYGEARFCDEKEAFSVILENTVWLVDPYTKLPVTAAMRHEGSITGTDFSSDGRLFLTASRDRTVRLWNAATGLPLGHPMRHEHEVRQAEISANGRQILTVDISGTVRLWDVANAQSVKATILDQNEVACALFSSDDRHVVTASADKTARLWDSATGLSIGEPMLHEGLITLIAASPDGRFICTASLDKAVRLWDARTGRSVGAPMRHGNQINKIRFSPDGQFVLTACADKATHLWNITTGQPVGDPMWHEGSVVDASFSPNGKRILTTSLENTVREWDAETGLPLAEPMRHDKAIRQALSTPDGKRIVTVDDDRIVRLWNAAYFTEEMLPVPEWVEDLACACSGLRFDSYSGLREMRNDERRNVFSELVKEGGPWGKLNDWIRKSKHDRPIGPNSEITLLQVAEQRRDSNTQEGLLDSLNYCPFLPLSHILLAEALQNKGESKRAEFLREYGSDFLPDDPVLLARASESFSKQMDFERAWTAVQAAIEFDSGCLPAHRAMVQFYKMKKQVSEEIEARNTLLALPNAEYSDYANAGMRAGELQIPDLAYKWFEDAERRFADEGKILFDRASSLVLLKKPDEAVPLYERYFSQYEKFGEWFARRERPALAAARWLSGDIEGAVADIHKILKYGVVLELYDDKVWNNVFQTAIENMIREIQKQHR